MFIKYKVTFLEVKVLIAIGNVNPPSPGINVIETIKKIGQNMNKRQKYKLYRISTNSELTMFVRLLMEIKPR